MSRTPLWTCWDEVCWRRDRTKNASHFRFLLIITSWRLDDVKLFIRSFHIRRLFILWPDNKYPIGDRSSWKSSFYALRSCMHEKLNFQSTTNAKKHNVRESTGALKWKKVVLFALTHPWNFICKSSQRLAMFFFYSESERISFLRSAICNGNRSLFASLFPDFQ